MLHVKPAACTVQYVAIERTEMMTVRLSSDERAMLEALAVEAGLRASDILRTLVRTAYREKFGDKKPQKSKRS